MSRSPEIPNQPEYLDPREAAEWFPYTFYFSQGDPDDAQITIITYLWVKSGGANLDASHKAQILESSKEKMHKVLHSPAHIRMDEDSYEVSSGRMVTELQRIFRFDPQQGMSKEKGDVEALLPELLDCIAQRDYYYLVKRGKRPAPGPLNDRYLSHICHYIMHLGEPQRTNSEYEFKNLPKVFQDMLADLRRYLKSLAERSKIPTEPLTDFEVKLLERIQAIISVYNLHHPESHASLDDLLKE